MHGRPHAKNQHDWSEFEMVSLKESKAVEPMLLLSLFMILTKFLQNCKFHEKNSTPNHQTLYSGKVC